MRYLQKCISYGGNNLRVFYLDMIFPRIPTMVAASHPFIMLPLDGFTSYGWHQPGDGPTFEILPTREGIQFEVFDRAPMSWWLMQFDQKYLFTGFLMEFNNGPDYVLAYLFDDSREPVYYQENGIKKVSC